MKRILIALLCAVMLFMPVPVYAAEDPEMVEISAEFASLLLTEWMEKAFKDDKKYANTDFGAIFKDGQLRVLFNFPDNATKPSKASVQELADTIYNRVAIETLNYKGSVYVAAFNKKKDYIVEIEYPEKNAANKSSENKSSTPKSTDKVTTGMENALKKAESLTKYSAYSKAKLRESLVKYNKFSEEEADYALENIKLDFKEQAVKKAESLMKYGSYSKEKLKESLVKYNQFTEEEAEHALKTVYDK